MIDLPEGTVYIEIRGIYDGVSVYKLPDGTLVNRWEPSDWKYQATQDWIARQLQVDGTRE
jgi:hypothetical protein